MKKHALKIGKLPYLTLSAGFFLISALFSCSLFFPYEITLTIQGEGTVSQDPPDLRFAPKSIVTLTPTPTEGWYFDGWVGSLNETTDPLSLIMDDDKTLTAVFKEVIPYTLNATWFASSSSARLTVLAEGGAAAADNSPASGDRYLTPPPAAYEETDRIIVRYKQNVVRSLGTKAKLEIYGTEVRSVSRPGFSTSVVKLDMSKAASIGKTIGQAKQDALDYYRSLPEVEYTEPDYRVWAFAPPNDDYYVSGDQWNFQLPQGFDMATVWDTATGAGVIVAVIDTGINTSAGLDDLAGVSFTAGYNFVAGNTVTWDDEGHGSHVSGTIAQATNNNTGCAGMAYGATLMPLKALDSAGSGYISDIADAITWAADHGANIISMSLGGPDYSATLEDACAWAYNRGVAIFAASGNDNTSYLSYPAALDDYVLAVGATNSSKTRAPFSNYGSSLDVMAPGESILQQSIPVIVGTPPDFTDGSGNYYFFQGTSMATPHAAALGALLKGMYPTLSPQGIYDAIRTSADDLGTTGFDVYTGWGLINPGAALNLGASLTQVTDEKIGNVNPRSDSFDDFSIAASLGSIRLSLSSTDTVTDLDLYLLDSSGNVLAASENTDSTELITYYTGSLAGTYTVRVKIYGGE